MGHITIENYIQVRYVWDPDSCAVWIVTSFSQLCRHDKTRPRCNPCKINSGHWLIVIVYPHLRHLIADIPALRFYVKINSDPPSSTVASRTAHLLLLPQAAALVLARPNFIIFLTRRQELKRCEI